MRGAGPGHVVHGVLTIRQVLGAASWSYPTLGSAGQHFMRQKAGRVAGFHDPGQQRRLPCCGSHSLSTRSVAWLALPADAAARLGSRHHCRQDGHVRGGTVGFMPAHSQRPQPGPSTPIEDLATALSVAVRIEPELIRAVRLGVFPNYGVAVEADLWFSDLVRSRGSHGIVFDEDVRHRLQGRLSKLLSRTSPSDPIHRVGAIIARIHDHLSPALLIEEKATWHAIRGEMSAVEEALRPALRAVALERRQGVVQWFTAARNRLPDSARSSVTAWKIAQVSQHQAVREKEDLPGIGSASLKTEDLADIVDMLDDTRLLVCRVGTELRVGDLDAADGVAAIQVPDTDPRLLKVLGVPSAEPPSVSVRRGAIATLQVGFGTIRLQTARELSSNCLLPWRATRARSRTLPRHQATPTMNRSWSGSFKVAT